jgi:amino acid adenylation domain-containing protein
MAAAGEPKRLDAWFRDALPGREDATAIVEGDRVWTFGEVDALARDWSARIGRHGATAVGVLAGRTASAYVGALAALYHGAVLVPLNPTFPAARTAAMVAATGADVVLVDVATQAELVADVVGRTGAEAIPVDARDEPKPAETIRDAGTGGIAYTLFTSGSSGVPKGVPISHANVSAFLAAATARYPLYASDRLVQAYDMTFDLALASLFLAWSQGCAIVPASVFALADPPRFVNRYGISVWASVPSAITLATDAGRLGPGTLPGLRLSMFCGEALTVDAAAAWAAAAPRSVVDNTYGPTELTMFCTAHTYQPGVDVSTGATVPIGRPFPGVDVLVVAPDGSVADTGELWLGGDQMFRGYLDPELDRAAFAEVGGVRWYRTGDLVSRGSAGLTHLGRLDDQLQVGGYRVEPAEVEQLIRAVLGVTTAVVVQHGTHLVAFVSPEPADDRPLVRLAAELPAYMCPKRLVVVDEVRLNANGKVDRGFYRSRAGAQR